MYDPILMSLMPDNIGLYILLIHTHIVYIVSLESTQPNVGYWLLIIWYICLYYVTIEWTFMRLLVYQEGCQGGC